MTDDLETYEGGITVKDVAGAYHPIPTPDGFSDLAFRNAVATVYTLFMRDGKLPSVTECHALWPRIPVETYSGLFLTPEFKEALSYRGIEFDEKAGLSLEQQMAILRMTDPGDHRPLSTKLKEMRIPMARWQAWQKHPLFRQLYVQRTESMFAESVQPAMLAIANKASSGDLNAAKMVLAITGRYREGDAAVQDAKQVVMAVVESVIKHVSDAETRAMILSEVQAQVVGFDVTHRNPSLEA